MALDAVDLGKGISSSENSADGNINRKECFKDISILPHNRKADIQNLKPVNVPIISYFRSRNISSLFLFLLKIESSFIQ